MKKINEAGNYFVSSISLTSGLITIIQTNFMEKALQFIVQNGVMFIFIFSTSYLVIAFVYRIIKNIKSVQNKNAELLRKIDDLASLTDKRLKKLEGN